MKAGITVWETAGGLRLAVLLLGLCLLPASAQSVSNDWFKIAGGGGVSSNGLLAISGTIGQHDATTFTDGSLLVVGGFWVAAEAYRPVAGTLVYGRSRGLSLKIKRADLVNNSFDPGGRSLALAGLNLTTTNGVTLTTNATHIFYENPRDVDDAFTYSISNGQGSPVTGTIRIQIIGTASLSSIKSLAVGVPGPGTNTITFAGIPGYQHVVQYATNLTTSPWFNLSTNLVPAAGLWSVLDPQATDPARFYRVAY